MELVMTVQKPAKGERADSADGLANGDRETLIAEAINELSVDKARNPGHVYGRILREALQKHLMLDDLHLSDVLIALRNAGYFVDWKSGLLYREKERRVA